MTDFVVVSRREENQLQTSEHVQDVEISSTVL
jgi:hypothetical protein